MLRTLVPNPHALWPRLLWLQATAESAIDLLRRRVSERSRPSPTDAVGETWRQKSA
jgi:hypothetical protein